jgi:hypothetical protein
LISKEVAVDPSELEIYSVVHSDIECNQKAKPKKFKAIKWSWLAGWLGWWVGG